MGSEEKEVQEFYTEAQRETTEKITMIMPV